jgi:hypothetical protein
MDVLDFAIAMMLFMQLPHQSMNVYIGMIATLGLVPSSSRSELFSLP